MKRLYIILIAIFASVIADAQWVEKNSGTTNDLFSVFFIDPNTGFAAGDKGTILRTIDAGESWVTLASGSTSNLKSIHFPELNTGFVAGYYGSGDSEKLGLILKTTDAGENWDTSLRLSYTELYSVYFFDADTGYTGGDLGTLLKTTDRGNHWTNLNSGTEMNYNSVYFVNSCSGYTVGNYYWHPFWSGEGGVLKTNSFGNQWTFILDKSGYFLNSTYFPTHDTGYTVGLELIYMGAGWYIKKSLLLQTVDSGTNWQKMPQTTSVPLFSVHFPNSSEGFAVGDSGIIYKTVNGGANWEYQTIATLRSLNSVYFTNDSTGYIVGQNGVILKTTNGGGYFVGLDKSNTESEKLKISPNPSSDIVSIQTPYKGSLFLFNPGGRQILQQSISQSTTTISIGDLPKGIYIVKVVGEKRVQMSKIVKQ